MSQLPMEYRGQDLEARTLHGCCVPYDEISYLTPNPNGERVRRGAFAKSIRQQDGKIFLFRAHDHSRPIGKALGFTEEADGLHGTFHIRENLLGDEVMADLREGYLPAMSIGFRAIQTRRGPNGETEVVEGMLKEVSILPLGAYDGARVLALRNPHYAIQIPQVVDLSPTVPGWAYR
jgi:HK97 family phage prohead protease